MSDVDAAWMQRALEVADGAEAAGEVPVGAVLVDAQGSLLAEGANRVIADADPTAHAEIVALRRAAARLGNYRLPGSTLYVTLEPCAMCAGALVHARVERVVFATRDPRAGASGSVFDILDHPMLNHRCRVDEGVLADVAADRLRGFFRARRRSARNG
ncbi:tRNA adenosine(34) deaminase TadA [Halomonas denitrificans]|nr:tRNA adenosine(34) deaminase TadA [Halomonas denitrificans]